VSPLPFRCVQIVASIEDSAAGPSYSVPRLSSELERQGITVSLFTVGGWRQTGDRTISRPAFAQATYPQNFAQIPGLKRFCFSRGLMNALSHCASDTEIFHSHGLWLMPNVYPSWAMPRAGHAVVISPRGMLGPEALQFSRLKKMAFWYLLQKSAVVRANCLHATSEQEYEEIRAFGLRNPVVVIPNGIDLPELMPDTAMENSERTVLSLGRVHPKKGLDRLLQAWAGVESDFPAWHLKIVGPDELGYTAKLKGLAAELRLSRVTFAAPLYGSAKFAALQNADLFVLATLNENFGLVVAESLAAGTPVISTKGAPWRDLAIQGCGWWIDTGTEALSAALAKAMVMPRPALKQMGAKGRVWMKQAFSWEKVAGDMLQVYRWLAAKDSMPQSLRLQ
jgi:glycosyltransferase involved in cell wall biosynthesis